MLCSILLESRMIKKGRKPRLDFAISETSSMEFDHLNKMLFGLHFFLLLVCQTKSASAAASLAKPGCKKRCGNISIPYPFGIGPGCYRNENIGFEIICKNESFRPTPVIASTELQLIKASLDDVYIRNSVAYTCHNSNGSLISNVSNISISLDGTPFTISRTRSNFFVIGCITWAIARGHTANEPQDMSVTPRLCSSACATLEDARDGTCNGSGCCSTAITGYLKSFNATIFSHPEFNLTGVFSFNPCSYAFIAGRKQYNFSTAHLSFDENFAGMIRDHVPLVLDWAVGNETCEEARRKPKTFACRDNSSCRNSKDGVGYRCICNQGFQGNPYLPKGCQVRGTKNKKPPLVKIIPGVGSGLVLLAGVQFSYWGLKQRRLKLKKKFFEQNGGSILQDIFPQGGETETLEIFTEIELEIATDKLEKATETYIKSRIFGRRGYPKKGILSDSRAVAMKKAKIADRGQIEQFINEVKTLSQINHRNVVKLLGCCLEKKDPLFVYEYASNGTLLDHIHGDNRLSWDTLLRIASETAFALAYLHSEASIPIVHGDVKSSNILLDDTYTAKLSDFGATRLIPMDKAELTTLVQENLGYLDPEFLLTSQLTEKSDVYSFGVVLVELLTGKVPFSSLRSEEERSLCQYFISSMKENRLYEILDPQVVAQGVEEQIVGVAELAKRCLQLKGDERPRMKEVAAELDRLRRFSRKNEEEIESEQLELEAGSTSGIDISISCGIDISDLFSG